MYFLHQLFFNCLLVGYDIKAKSLAFSTLGLELKAMPGAAMVLGLDLARTYLRVIERGEDFYKGLIFII